MVEPFEHTIARLSRELADYNLEKRLQNKKEVQERFGDVLSPKRIWDLQEDQIKSFLDLDNNRHWTLQRQKTHITRDMEALRVGLSVLLNEERPLAARYTEGVGLVDGMGRAIATAILQVAYPDRYGVWNGKSEGAMRILGVRPETERGSTEGEQYAAVNEVLSSLADELEIDLWTLDYLWNDIDEMDRYLPTSIPYLKQPGTSKFYPVCVEAIQSWDKVEDDGELEISFDAEKEGKAGDVFIRIDHSGEKEFSTTWNKSSEWTVFPARIRAAATALRDTVYTGQFRIEHESGELTIEPESQNWIVASESPASAEDYFDAFREIEQDLTEEERKVLHVHYSASDQTVTADSVAEDLSFGGGASIRDIYGELGEKVAGDLGQEKYLLDSGQEAYWPFLASGIRGGSFRFVLRPEVASALEQVGWFDAGEEERHLSGTEAPEMTGRGSDNPKRLETTTTRTVRDTQITRTIKQVHDHRCQRCKEVLEFSNGERYAEAHHIKPLGKPHEGPDRQWNVLCVCPNCHVLLDRGAVPLDLSKLRTVGGHEIGEEVIEYHNEEVYQDE